MSWAKLLGDRRITKLPPSKAELDNLRSIVARSLRDAAAANADAKFVMAYDAARTLSLMIVRAEGYRPRSAGGHYNTFLNTFLALDAADPSFARLSAYFDGCRIKRNKCEYVAAGGISDTDAQELFTTAERFAKECETWIKRQHPGLA